MNSLKLTLFALLMFVAGTIGASASTNSALDKARQMSREAGIKVENVKKDLSEINPDSISETVVFETAAEESGSSVGYNDNLDESDDMDDALIIPILAIIFGTTVPFATVVLIFLIVFNSKIRLKKMKYGTIDRAIAAGCPLPDSFYRSETPTKNRLQSGIVWFGWGVAFMTYGFLRESEFLLAIGFIPAFIGLSRIAVYYIDYRRMSQHKADDDNDAE